MKKMAIASILIAMLLFAGYNETHYTRKDCVITEVNGSLVCAEDVMGREWEFFVDEDVPAVGTKVNLEMYTNHTDSTIFDDEVVGFKVVG